jgi:peptide/nickel transport system substrate-binding protein
MGWTIPFDPDAYDVWHSSKTKSEELNFISYNNPKADKILEKGRSTFDQKERKNVMTAFRKSSRKINLTLFSTFPMP